MPHQPLMPANIRPAPTKPDRARKAGATHRPSSTPSRISVPATICTWRMISIGWLRSATTGKPAFFQASIPPSRT
jgi:hypothetical protein